jgi:hypothetical protein
MKKQIILLAGLLFVGCAHAKPKSAPQANEGSCSIIVLPVPKHHKKIVKPNKPKETTLKQPIQPSNSVVTPSQTPSASVEKSITLGKLFNILLVILVVIIAFLVLHLAPSEKKRKKH